MGRISLNHFFTLTQRYSCIPTCVVAYEVTRAPAESLFKKWVGPRYLHYFHSTYPLIVASIICWVQQVAVATYLVASIILYSSQFPRQYCLIKERREDDIAHLQRAKKLAAENKWDAALQETSHMRKEKLLDKAYRSITYNQIRAQKYHLAVLTAKLLKSPTLHEQTLFRAISAHVDNKYSAYPLRLSKIVENQSGFDKLCLSLIRPSPTGESKSGPFLFSLLQQRGAILEAAFLLYSGIYSGCAQKDAKDPSWHTIAQILQGKSNREIQDYLLAHIACKWAQVEEYSTANQTIEHISTANKQYQAWANIIEKSDKKSRAAIKALECINNPDIADRIYTDIAQTAPGS